MKQFLYEDITTDTPLKVRFENLQYWKNEFRKTIKEMDDEESVYSETELQQRFSFIEKKYANAEEVMIDVTKGMYFGTAFRLDQNSNPEPFPFYAKWKNVSNHVGFKGTTRVGKTVNMANHIEQLIANNFDVIIIDPKGGINQEVLSTTAQSCFKYGRTEDMMYFSPAFSELSHKMNVLYGRSNIEIASMIIDSIAEPNMESFYLEVGTRILLAETTAFEYLQMVTDPEGILTTSWEEEESKKYSDFVNNFDGESYGIRHKDIIERLHSQSVHDRDFEELKGIGFNRTLITFGDLERFCSYKGLENLYKLILAIPYNASEIKSIAKVQKLKDEALRILTSALRTDIAHFSKVADTLANRLLQLSVGPVGEMLCGTRINPLANRLRRKDKGVVAVIQPFPMKFKKSSDMLVKTLIGSIDAMLGTVGAEGRGFPRKIAVCIDEAGASIFPGFENCFNRWSGLGASMFVYTQSDEDYTLAVGENNANVIIDNVNTKGIMRQNLLKSALMAAEDIGKVATYKTIAMISAGGSDGRYSSDVSEEYLCTPDDIKALPMGEGVMTHNGEKLYVEFPYRLPPKGTFNMPELSTEKSQRYLVEYEAKLELLKQEELSISKQIQEGKAVDEEGNFIQKLKELDIA